MEAFVGPLLSFHSHGGAYKVISYKFVSHVDNTNEHKTLLTSSSRRILKHAMSTSIKSHNDSLCLNYNNENIFPSSGFSALNFQPLTDFRATATTSIHLMAPKPEDKKQNLANNQESMCFFFFFAPRRVVQHFFFCLFYPFFSPFEAGALNLRVSHILGSMKQISTRKEFTAKETFYRAVIRCHEAIIPHFTESSELRCSSRLLDSHI